MALLNWDDRLLVGVEPMDQTHREFVELLGELARAAEADTISALDRLIEHTVLHFRQEEEFIGLALGQQNNSRNRDTFAAIPAEAHNHQFVYGRRACLGSRWGKLGE